MAATLLGFLLTIVWERRKRKDERCRLDIDLLTLMEEEVATNLAVLELNDILLKHELEAVDQGLTEVDALVPVQVGAWESVRVDLARWFPDHTAIMSRFRSLDLVAPQLNSLIRDRARFRLDGRSLQTYAAEMRELDETIIEKNDRVRDQLERVQADLRQLEVTIGVRKKPGRSTPKWLTVFAREND